MPTFRDNLHLGSKDPLIDADSIADRSITNNKLACDSVGSCQIQDGAVTQEKTTGIMPEIYALRDKLDQRTAEREAADRDLQADVAALKRTSVKSVSVNSGTKVYPDANGNVNLPIAIDEGGQPYTPPDITELQNDVAALQDAVEAMDELLSGDGGIDDRLSDLESAQQVPHSMFIPLGEILGTSPSVEEGTLDTAVLSWDYVWDTQQKRLLLRGVQNGSIMYWAQWTENAADIPSDRIDIHDCFYYTLNPTALTIYHWEGNAYDGDIVSVGSGDDTYVQNWIRHLTSFLYPVLRWGSSNTLPNGGLWKEGQLWYNTATNKMMICLEDQASSLTPPSFTEYPFNLLGEGFFFNAEHKEIYVYANGEFRRFTNGGSGSTIIVDTDLSPTSTNPVENKAVNAAIGNLQQQINAIGGSSIDIDHFNYAEDVRYPEHYGAKGTGINYYDWPLVCFGGYAPTNIVISQDTSNFEVEHPSERLWNDIVGIEDFECTANDVLYSNNLKMFLLYKDGVYYKKWVNASLWNDGNEPRKDTVFSDISLETNNPSTPRQAKRISYIYNETSQQLVNIVDTMDDDTVAMYKWWKAAEQGISLRLAPKIYFMANAGGQTSANDMLVNKDFRNIVIDGQGGVIFPRTATSGLPHDSYKEGTTTHSNSIGIGSVQKTLFSIDGCQNLVIQNMTIKTLRDRDCSCVGGSNARISSSDSRIAAFGLRHGNASASNINKNIYFRNLEFKNMLYDFVASNGSSYMNQNIRIDGWKSEGVLWNVFRTVGLYISHADVTSAKLCGGAGFHHFYFQNDKNVHVWDSSFRQPDDYNEVMISLSTSTQTGNVPFEFKRCNFEAVKVITGSTKYMNFKFIDCRFRQVGTKRVGNMAYTDSGTIIQLQAGSYTFHDCIFHINKARAMDTGTNSDQTLEITDSYFFTDSGYPSNQSIVNYSHNLVSEHCYTNYNGPSGINAAPTQSGGADVASLRSDVETIQNIIGGGEVPTGMQPSAAPLAPSVGDVYLDSTDSKYYRCENAGEQSVLTLYVNAPSNDYDGSNVDFSYDLTENETVSFRISSPITGVGSVKDQIAEQLTTAGYSYIFGTTQSAGQTQNWVRITSKYPCAIDNPTTAEVPNTFGMLKTRESGGKTTNYKSYIGKDPTWVEIQTTGLVSLLQSLEARVAALEGD